MVGTEAIKGTVRTISKPYNGGWRFASVHPHEGMIVGELGDLQPGDTCLFKGAWKNNTKYGKQFHTTAVEIEIPRDKGGIMTYLNRHFKWVGPIRAKKLVDIFGEDLFRIIEEEPSLLSAAGISPKQSDAIRTEFLSIKEDQGIDVFFATNGISISCRNRLVDRYGSKSQAMVEVKRNPYNLADEVIGIGFKKADEIAMRIGIKKDSKIRIYSGVRWVLEQAAQSEGHCFVPLEELDDRSAEILQCGRVVDSVHQQVRDGVLLDISGHIYIPQLYNSERIVATRLRKLINAHHKTIIHDLTQDELNDMDPDQRRALELALSSKISIITGGPGVGKTHMIKQIIRALGPNDKKIYLAAPTGKAAKRMNEATGMEATTIHRLLEYSMQLNGFTRNSHNPLDCDTLIIDETSMIDIRLMASLMDAFNGHMQVIFVGDVNQLPSVGPGRVLADMIDSEVIPVAWLNTLHRQAKDSAINLNAKQINAGKKLDLSRADSDFWVCIEENVERIPDLITKTCKAIPRKYPEFTLNDIQVLCPQKRSAIGTKNLNEALRPILNPDGVKLKGVEFYSGDRVIQTKNNYNLEIFNGEIGRVSHVDNEFLHLYRDDGRLLKYPLDQVTELKPAYALTIHKSQGSEFPCVIIPVHTSNYIMLQRNLLYTGITRGKKLVVLIGTMKAINLAIKTIDSKTRYTNLKRFIQNGVSE